MPPAAAVPTLFSATAETIASPPSSVTSSVVLRTEIAAVAEQQLFAGLRALGAPRDHRSERAATLIRALAESIQHQLTESDPTDSDFVSMVNLQQLVANICEYVGSLVQTCFGKGGKPQPRGPDNGARDLVERVCSSFDERDAESDVSCSPVKSEEIRPAQSPEVRPYDAAFQRLQDSLRDLDAQRKALRERMESLVVDHTAARQALDKLEERVYHRLDRARARNVQFIVKIEEVWLQDPDSLALLTEPCADCAKSRSAKLPPLKHPSPAKPTATTSS